MALWSNIGIVSLKMSEFHQSPEMNCSLSLWLLFHLSFCNRGYKHCYRIIFWYIYAQQHGVTSQEMLFLMLISTITSHLIVLYVVMTGKVKPYLIPLFLQQVLSVLSGFLQCLTTWAGRLVRTAISTVFKHSDFLRLIQNYFSY